MASGDLSEAPFPLLLKRLHQSGTTGALAVTVGPHSKRVYVSRGAVVFAASTDRNDRLGEMLLRLGEITLAQYFVCSKAVGRGKRFGTILVEQGVLGPEKLVWAVKTQVKEIVFSLFDLPAGAWRFLAGEDAGEEMITLNINTPDLIKEGVRRMDSVSKPLEALGSADLRLRLTLSLEVAGGMFNLSEDERALLSSLGSPVDLGTLSGASRMKPDDLLKFLWALHILDVLEVGPAGSAASAASQEGPDEMEVTGDDLADLLPPGN